MVKLLDLNYITSDLVTCHKLTSLNLSDNELSDRCAEAIYNILSKTKKREIDLHVLNLSGNSLSCSFIKKISSQLIQNENLKSFAIKDNNIEADGIQELLKVISKNNYILSLDLRNNPGFTKKASLTVLEKLKNNLNKFRLSNAVKKSVVKETQKDEFHNKSNRSIHDLAKNRSKSPSRNKNNEGERIINIEGIGIMHEDQPIKIKDVKIDEKNDFHNMSVKRSNSFTNDLITKCPNCENLREKVLRLEFENKKLRIKLNELNRNPAILNSCNLIRFYNKSFSERIS